MIFAHNWSDWVGLGSLVIIKTIGRDSLNLLNTQTSIISTFENNLKYGKLISKYITNRILRKI